MRRKSSTSGDAKNDTEATTAYWRFRAAMDRFGILLEVGLVGFSVKKREHEGLAKKLVFPPVPGRMPLDYEPDIDFVVTDDGANVRVTADLRVFQILRQVTALRREHYSQARFYLYSILAVSLWAAYETYVVMMLEQLYRIRPQLLKSGEQVDYAFVVDHAGDPIGALIERQLSAVGHMSFTETTEYLAKRINHKIDANEQKALGVC